VSAVDLSSFSRAVGGSQPLKGYRAVPVGPGPWPGVVMVHEAFGLDDVMRRQADRLAAAGYLTVAPDLFSAGGARRCLMSTLRAVSSGQGRAMLISRRPVLSCWPPASAPARSGLSGSAWAAVSR